MSEMLHPIGRLGTIIYKMRLNEKIVMVCYSKERQEYLQRLFPEIKEQFIVKDGLSGKSFSGVIVDE